MDRAYEDIVSVQDVSAFDAFVDACLPSPAQQTHDQALPEAILRSAISARSTPDRKG
jgi:hypothetical protein